ncbi:MAG TPA: hypothetical protein PLR06_06675 [Cyclobacteriaceae bacterium]|nr:hypothetical protein [Cyclobacteriaceae bacterium]
MADWIWITAESKGITEIEIDILNDKVKPKELEIKPITAQLKELRETIQLTFKATLSTRLHSRSNI